MPSDEFLGANRRSWDERVPIHRRDRSGFYAVERFLAGEKQLHAIELGELGDVRGKRLIHLQCHFGLDTLILARHGADVTGVEVRAQCGDIGQLGAIPPPAPAPCSVTAKGEQAVVGTSPACRHGRQEAPVVLREPHPEMCLGLGEVRVAQRRQDLEVVAAGPEHRACLPVHVPVTQTLQTLTSTVPSRGHVEHGRTRSVPLSSQRFSGYAGQASGRCALCDAHRGELAKDLRP